MREILRLLVFVAIIAGGLVLGRFAWAKYIAGKKETTLEGAAAQTKEDVIARTNELDKNLGKILGESEPREGLATYIKEELPQMIQTQVQKSEVISQIQTEVTKIVEQTTEKVQQLPEEELKKIKKSVAQEICNQLTEKEASESGN